MDLGDLLFLGIVVASAIGSAVGGMKKKKALAGGAKKKNAFAGGVMKKTARPTRSAALPATLDTGLQNTPASPPRRPRPSTPTAASVKRLAPATSVHSTKAPVLGVQQLLARPRRRHWREYLIMKEVLGPPVSLRGMSDDSEH